MDIPVVVIGMGVSGLTCALDLLRNGHSNVQVWAPRMGALPTNAVCTNPVNVEDPEGPILGWTMDTIPEFRKLLAVPEAGVCICRTALIGLDNVIGTHIKDANYVHSLSVLSEPSFAYLIAQGRYGDAEAWDAVSMNSKTYMFWLHTQVKEAGGTFVRRKVQDLREVSETVGQRVIIVNTSGLGARELVGDEGVYPCRGQICHVYAPEITSAVVDLDSLAYVFPIHNGGGYVECGGTAEDGNGSTVPEAAVTADIMTKVSQMIPLLAGRTPEDATVCIRPKRKGGVRLELEQIHGIPVVHNYGHGGSGYLASWGCAFKVRELVREAATRLSRSRL